MTIGQAVEKLRDAIQDCEEFGLVYHGDTVITGAIINDNVIELVEE